MTLRAFHMPCNGVFAFLRKYLPLFNYPHDQLYLFTLDSKYTYFATITTKETYCPKGEFKTRSLVTSRLCLHFVLFFSFPAQDEQAEKSIKTTKKRGRMQVLRIYLLGEPEIGKR